MAGTGNAGKVKEQWRRVRGWPYAVSNTGRIVRLSAAQGTKAGIVVKPKLTSGGYARVCLQRKGERWYPRVHRLVAQAFIGPSRGRQINHKNGNKLDNTVENLEWVTPAENMQHASEHGMRPHGEKHQFAKLSDDQVREMKKRLAAGEAPINLAHEYDIDASVVRRIKRGEAWKHI